LKKVQLLILSGGFSNRMGVHKALLSINDMSNLEYLIKRYQNSGLIEHIVVVLNVDLVRFFPALVENIEVLVNDFPNKGRGYSMGLGINELSENLPAFIQNIDNPPPDSMTIEKMLRELANKEKSYVVPKVNDRNAHPVLIGKGLLGELKRIQEVDWNLKEELKQYNRIELSVEDKYLLLNLNTPEEWEIYVSSIKEKAV
jgi:CTP:molybdopterin cytidylyltransferase MocA